MNDIHVTVSCIGSGWAVTQYLLNDLWWHWTLSCIVQVSIVSLFPENFQLTYVRQQILQINGALWWNTLSLLYHYVMPTLQQALSKLYWRGSISFWTWAINIKKSYFYKIIPYNSQQPRIGLKVRTISSTADDRDLTSCSSLDIMELVNENELKEKAIRLLARLMQLSTMD